LEEEVKLGDDAERFYYRHTDLGFVRSLADGLDIGFNFKHVSARGDGNDWISENRPHLNLTFKGKWADLALSDRSRLEFRDIDNVKNFWRYRNKFTVKFPWELTALKLKPYVAEEIFINLDQSGIVQHRLYSGFSAKLSDNLSGSLFYLWLASNSNHSWIDIHILGTQFVYWF